MRILKFITPAPYRQSVLKAAFVSLAGVLAFLIPAAGVSSTTALPGRNGTILAASGSSLYSISADGRQKKAVGRIRVLKDSGTAEAAWSPDGTRIAFTARTGGIFIADSNGRRVRRIATRGHAPAWSPDGTQLVFTRGAWLYLVEVGGGNPSPLFRGRNAQWSPDGTQLAFEASDNGLSNAYIGSLDGSRRQRLTNAWSGECSSHLPAETRYWDPEWAPDARRLALVEWSSCGSNYSTTIYAIALDGSGWEVLVEPNGNVDSGVWDPVWAPDGSAIAYVDDRGDGADWGLSVLTFGGRPRTIAKLEPFAWRPRCNIGGRLGSDRLSGSSRSELICGFGGNDTITGGAGADRLFGENGKDRFFSRDGEFDVIGCGAGRDTVFADTVDLVGRDCERVDRR